MSTFPPWHPRWGEGMPSPSPRSRPLVVEPAAQLLRRKPHRVEVIARSVREVGVRPHPNMLASASNRSKNESRTTNSLDVVWCVWCVLCVLGVSCVLCVFRCFALL